ncbi:dTDP-4-dehydrorhamnose reductase [Janthinobacterium agaricidamnosum]|uniref:dTDP-4-dehydrorhamnose reductase n=1 Tax=Janthinobacterium agaricidamnosum NBRC 102515 = DSM 9628 TaxID=1349767 RepID=W0V1U8_9BURK|nr:dTDP-4-dehydrorhamnose reductase [Janthinobacterium agaricidamnosum]CDG81585.1 dTDP-4-dehydrorhamnose reductase [Janthinobacterium agaricidamnosum NBRC 102515 = DSM 9628]
MKILLTGSSGQVGYELARSLQGLGEVVAPGRSGMDLANLDQVRDVIRTVKPGLIVNPAAYTAVDQAEREPELALLINARAPEVMAEEARKLGAAMIHYSTDYVFDGSKSGPYVEDDPTCPVNVYGRSKLAGEQAIQACGIDHLILRTSWVYGMRGKNFLLTVLRLAQERPELRIVGDQYGAPTWCRTIADTTAHILARMQADADPAAWWRQHGGIYHLTAQGRTSWAGFTQEILNNAPLVTPPRVSEITTAEYPLPARRPASSVLSSERLMQAFCGLPAWEDALQLCMAA